MEQFVKNNLFWIREPENYEITDEKITIVSQPNTDLWQRTYYGFCNDNAPCLQIKTNERYFSFTVKTKFNSSVIFDQCGIVMYLDSENWAKASIEYENDEYQRQGMREPNPSRFLRAYFRQYCVNLARHTRVCLRSVSLS